MEPKLFIGLNIFQTVKITGTNFQHVAKCRSANKVRCFEETCCLYFESYVVVITRTRIALHTDHELNSCCVFWWLYNVLQRDLCRTGVDVLLHLNTRFQSCYFERQLKA
jgi:hypothetical protein